MAEMNSSINKGTNSKEKIDNHTKNYEAAILVNVMLDQDESHGQFSKAA